LSRALAGGQISGDAIALARVGRQDKAVLDGKQDEPCYGAATSLRIGETITAAIGVMFWKARPLTGASSFSANFVQPITQRFHA